MNNKALMIVLGALLVMVGCAGKVREPNSPTPQGAEFVEPDMDESEGIEGYQDVQLTAEDNQIVVPGASHGAAPAMKKKSKKAKKTNPAFWPKSDNIGNLLEDLQWGMTVKRVFSIFEKKIRAEYQEKMNAARGDLLAEDRIRSQMHKELNKVKDSYVSFSGQNTGYESHMVDVEFTHNNNESMLVWDAGKYVEYLFFIDNRFWKRVRLFRIDQLNGISLEEFNSSMESVLGCKGAELKDEDGNVTQYAWRDDSTYAVVLDGSKFFGVYGLRLISAVTKTHIAKLRTNKGRSSGSVDSSTSSTIDKAVTSVNYNDSQESVIDSYTGKGHSGGGLGSDEGSNKSDNASKPKSKASKNEPSKNDLDDLF